MRAMASIFSIQDFAKLHSIFKLDSIPTNTSKDETEWNLANQGRHVRIYIYIFIVIYRSSGMEI